MFSSSDAHVTTEAPTVSAGYAKKVPFRKIACFLHDIPRAIFKNMDGLAEKVLEKPRSHRSQRRWAACVNRSDDARKLLEKYANSSYYAQPLSSGCARAILSQKLKKSDAVEIMPTLKKTCEDLEIVEYLAKKHGLAETIRE